MAFSHDLAKCQLFLLTDEYANRNRLLSRSCFAAIPAWSVSLLAIHPVY